MSSFFAVVRKWCGKLIKINPPHHHYNIGNIVDCNSLYTVVYVGDYKS